MNANWIKSCALLAGLMLVSLTAQAAPTVTLTAPEAGQVFIFPAAIPLAADAEDNDGTITRVDFYQGNTLIGTATSAPYTATWNDAPIGNYYNITAKATDDRGAVTTSATRNISVRAAPPTVELSSPEDGQQYPVAPTVTLSVNATAAPGASIKSVDYFRGTVWIATVTSAPYTYTWNDVGSGTHVITARVIDDKGGTATSAARTISVKFNDPPTVALTAPEEGQVFIFPADVPLAADAEDNDGTITKVDFYRGSTLIGTATSAPYTATWNDAPIGNYYNQIAARATDDRGAVTTSATRSISVRTAPPTVELSSPEDGQQYPVAPTVTLSVNATAAPGASIKSVDYFRGTVWIATVTSAPYTYTWNDVGSGTHVITARVIDDKGGTATSAARTISVKFNAPPTVALTAPEEGQVFIFPADVSLAANAEDNDGTITKVDFYRGNTLIGTATSAPYTATWNDAPIGNYYNQIAAKATDDRGAVTTSATRSISVRTAPPTVELSSPEDGQQYVATATVELSVNATAATGASIKSVDYFRGTVRIATVTSAPYTYTWNDVAAGTHVMTARVIDDKNSTATSAARTITVKANEPPAVTLTAPETGQSFAAPANITISAGATDSDGAIARVDFYQGATLIGTATSTPYALSWNNVPIGAYSLTAKATDDKSATTTSAAHTIIVKANKAPTVALTAPEAEKNFAAPANITINAGATDSDGTIARVDFYRGATLIGTTTSTPYAISWNNVPIGTYSLTAKATDDKGATTTSAARGITVKVNQPPAIDLSAPADNQGYYGAPASITLMADATDSDGTITRVDFYQGNALIGTATSAPYAVTWNDVAIGAYSLTAKATDDKGASTTSAARTVEVEDSATREIYYIHSDHLNTPRLITDKQNQTVWRHSPLNEPFGAGTPEEDPDSTGNHFKFNLRFPGQYYDQETQTHYNYHRDYHPQTGRYLQSDPIGLEGGINPYAYVSGNPMRWIDPEGFATAVVGGLGFGASSGAAVGAGAGVAAGAAVAGAGVAGYAVGSAIYPHIEPSLSKAIDWCTSVMTGSGRWSCTASCNVQVISPSLDGKVSGRITGNAKGKTQQEACVEAKRVATQSVPRGTYARHCQCSCSKN